MSGCRATCCTGLIPTSASRIPQCACVPSCLAAVGRAQSAFLSLRHHLGQRDPILHGGKTHLVLLPSLRSSRIAQCLGHRPVHFVHRRVATRMVLAEHDGALETSVYGVPRRIHLVQLGTGRIFVRALAGAGIGRMVSPAGARPHRIDAAATHIQKGALHVGRLISLGRQWHHAFEVASKRVRIGTR